MKKVKVVHIITMLELGGAQGNTLYTVANLNKTKYDVTLITGPGGILDTAAQQVKDIKLFYVPHLIRQLNPLRDGLAFYRLYRILKKVKPDLVHTHSSKAGILGRWAAYLAGVKCIVHTFHGMGFNRYQKFPIRELFIFSEQTTALITTQFIAVAANNIIRLLMYNIGQRNKYILIRSGIKINRFLNVNRDVKEQKRTELNLAPTDKVVLTIGPFKPQKNMVDFVRVAGIVIKKNPATKFFIVGDGEQRRIIETEIAIRKLQNYVTLLGWRDDIPELLAITDVFVLTSLWEGLPRSVVEAMAAGKPVVATAVDGTREIVVPEVTGYLTRPFQIEIMAQYIVKLLTHPELVVLLGNAGRTRIHTEFDIDEMVRQQERLYDEMVS